MFLSVDVGSQSAATVVMGGNGYKARLRAAAPHVLNGLAVPVGQRTAWRERGGARAPGAVVSRGGARACGHWHQVIAHSANEIPYLRIYVIIREKDTFED